MIKDAITRCSGEKTMNKNQPNPQSISFGDGKTWWRGPMIGKGNYGSVYLANLKKPKYRHSYLPPVMAVKSAEISVSSSHRKEKQVLHNLQGCSNILGYFGEEITTDSNGKMVHNLLLEYASGGDLGNLINKSENWRLPEFEVRHHTRSILQGLNHIHDHNLVHCDLKPENILLVPTTSDSNKFVAKIGDFGLTKRAKQSGLDTHIRGSRLFMSPEVVINKEQEPPSDIWALGCVVLEMLTGNSPWDRETDGEDKDDLVSRIATDGAVPNIPDWISEDGKSFLKGCFEREPRSRPTAKMLLNHPFVAEDVDKDKTAARLNHCPKKTLLSSVVLTLRRFMIHLVGRAWLGLKELATLSLSTTPRYIPNFTIPAGLWSIVIVTLKPYTSSVIFIEVGHSLI